MALRAGYYGIKNKLLNKLISLPKDIDDLEAILDSDPVTITPTANATVTQNNSIKNGIVTKILCSITKDDDENFVLPTEPIGTTVTIGSVPEDCRPSQAIVGSGVNGKWLYDCIIRTNGEIAVRVFNKDEYGLKDISINVVY